MTAMASPLFSAAWWLPALHRGETSPDDVIEALLRWAREHRVVAGDGHTYHGLAELLRMTRAWDMRLVQVLPGDYGELSSGPTHLDTGHLEAPSQTHMSVTALGELITSAGGSALALGHPVERPDGVFVTSEILTATVVAPQMVVWHLTPFHGTLSPIVNEGPRAALGSLRMAEEESLRCLETSSMVADAAQQEDFRNALIDIDEALLISDSILYPLSVDSRYLQLLLAADHVDAIVAVARKYAQTTEAALLPLLRTVQRARGTAWNEWHYGHSAA